MSRTLVVGPGAVGLTLAAAHAASGEEVALLGRRAGPWQAQARGVGVSALTRLRGAWRSPDTVLLTVRDDDLELAAEAMAVLLERAGRKAAAFHTCGLRGLGPLEPFAEFGWRTAALHPLLPFPPTPDPGRLRGGLVVVEAAYGSLAAARRVLAIWKARPIPLQDGEARASYHLAATLASNHVTGLLGWATSLASPALGSVAGMAMLQLAASSLLANLEHGSHDALTGPMLRGDTATLRAHLETLPARERGRYVDLLRVLLRFAESTGRMAATDLRNVRRFLREATAP